MHFQLEPHQEGVAEPVPQPEGRGTEVGAAGLKELQLPHSRFTRFTRSTCFTSNEEAGVDHLSLLLQIVSSCNFFVMRSFDIFIRIAARWAMSPSLITGYRLLRPACGTMGSTSTSQEISYPPCGPRLLWKRASIKALRYCC